MAVRSISRAKSEKAAPLVCFFPHRRESKRLMAQQQHSDPGPILVVDDEPSIRTALCEVLNRTGHPVLVARDGQEALALLEQRSVWLVITDLRMPRLGGLELLREIKRRFSQTLVVLITGYATLESAIEAIRAGASDYLMKPFDSEAVAALIRRLEEGSQSQETAAQAPSAAAPALLGAL